MTVSPEQAKQYEAAALGLVGSTLCVLMTFDDNGNVLMQFHGPINASVDDLVRASIGPCVVESLLPMEQAIPHLGLPNGVIIAHEGDASGV